METQKQPKPSKNRQKSAARLVASQLIYEHLLTEADITDLMKDFKDNRLKTPIDEEGEDALVEADIKVLADILHSFDQNKDAFSKQVKLALTNKNKEPESLLNAIMLAAAAEMFIAGEKGIDKPIIINDYVEVTRAFFNEGEVKFMNGTLDAISKAI